MMSILYPIQQRHIFLRLISILVISVVNNCAQEGKPTKYNPPTNIKNFKSVQSGNAHKFYLLLEDINGESTPSDGIIEMEIFDQFNNSLYYGKFNVKASGFTEISEVLTGTNIGKGYVWKIPLSKIKRGFSFTDYGRIALTFTSSEGRALSCKDKLPIPLRSKEEHMQILENEYEKSSVVVNQTVSKGNFAITVSRVGYFNLHGIRGINECYRVDMIVKNIGSDEEYFDPLVKGGSFMTIEAFHDNKYYKYQTINIGTLDRPIWIASGGTRKGFVLFRTTPKHGETMPKSVKSLSLEFELGHYPRYQFVFDITLKGRRQK